MISFPFIDVSVNGNPVSDFFYSQLVSATIHDAPGQEADRVDLKFDDIQNSVEMPSKGAIVVVRFGFKGFAGQKMGRFVVESATIEGGGDGEFILVSGGSADVRSDIKEPVSENFDEMTVGQIVETLAKRHGFDAKVDAAFASQKLPYTARYQQGTDDFLTRLADRFGALFAPKDGKFLFLPRGTLGAVTIDKSECDNWTFQVDPRPLYGKAEAGWFDRAKGEVKLEEAETGLQGASRRLRRVFPSQAEAQAAAKSESQRLARATGSGSITLAGRPDIMADAPINATGFRAEANGLWQCASVEHVYEDTYMTTVEVEAPEAGKT